MDFQDLLNTVERHAGRTFRHRDAVAFLLETAEQRNMAIAFSDAIFQAKFLVRTREVMARIGQGAEVFDKLGAEFKESLEKASTLLRTLVKESDGEAKVSFVSRFLSMDQGSLERLFELFNDLAILKNWEVDGNTLPLTGYPSARRRANERPVESVDLRFLIRGARLAFVLLVLLLIIDGPFTILGWIIAVVVGALILVVHFEAMMSQKRFNRE